MNISTRVLAFESALTVDIDQNFVHLRNYHLRANPYSHNQNSRFSRNTGCISYLVWSLSVRPISFVIIIQLLILLIVLTGGAAPEEEEGQASGSGGRAAGR